MLLSHIRLSKSLKLVAGYTDAKERVKDLYNMSYEIALVTGNEQLYNEINATFRQLCDKMKITDVHLIHRKESSHQHIQDKPYRVAMQKCSQAAKGSQIPVLIEHMALIEMSSSNVETVCIYALSFAESEISHGDPTPMAFFGRVKAEECSPQRQHLRERAITEFLSFWKTKYMRTL